jgi:hypothetical protein
MNDLYMDVEHKFSQLQHIGNMCTSTLNMLGSKVNSWQSLHVHTSCIRFTSHGNKYSSHYVWSFVMSEGRIQRDFSVQKEASLLRALEAAIWTLLGNWNSAVM